MFEHAGWYLTYPYRDLVRFARSARNVYHVMAADLPLSAAHIDDRARVGEAAVATAFAGYVAYTQDPAWLAAVLLVGWYLLTRDSYRRAQRIAQLTELAGHAAFIIDPKRTAPDEVYIENPVYDGNKLVGFTVCYGRDWKDSKETNRDDLVKHLRGKLYGDDAWKQVWNTADDYVRWYIHDPGLPDYAPLQLHPDLPWWKIPFGVQPAAAPLVVNLRRTPHILIVARTGQGKTSQLRAAIAHVLHAITARGAHAKVVIIDPKRIEFRAMRRMPGVTKVATSPKDMRDTIIEYRDKMRRWYDAAEQDIDRPKLATVLVIDELAVLMARLSPEHRDEVSAAIDEIAVQARSCGLHLLMATQQPSAANTISTDARAQTVAIATGPMGPQGSQMATGDSRAFQSEANGGYASSHPGRCVSAHDDTYTQFQAYHVEDPVHPNPDLPPEKAETLRDLAATLFPPVGSHTMTVGPDGEIVGEPDTTGTDSVGDRTNGTEKQDGRQDQRMTEKTEKKDGTTRRKGLNRR